MEAKKAKMFSMKMLSMKYSNVVDPVFVKIYGAANLGEMSFLCDVRDKSFDEKSFLFDFLVINGYELEKMNVRGDDFDKIFISWKNV